MDAPPSPLPAKLAAWSVHALTATGAAVGVAALVAISEGDFFRAATAMIVAFAIDSVDGTLARRLRVHEVIPRIDGRRLDDIVDFLNYVIVPLVFMVEAGALPGWAWCAAPAMASGLGFANVDAKTEDDFFLGFPSYWNVVALYAWLLELTPGVGAALVTVLAVAVLAPIKFVYPSKMHRLRRTTLAATAVWGLLLVACVLAPRATADLPLIELSLGYIAYYFVVSFALGGIHRGEGARKADRIERLPTEGEPG